MNEFCKLIILIIIILLLLSLGELRENLQTKYTVNPNYQPSTSSSSNNNLSSTQFPKSVNFKPWYKPWSNGANTMYCYVDNHLQRRCFWKCNNQNI